MTPQLRPEMRPNTRLAGHSAAGPRSEKRPIRSRSRLMSARHVVGGVARNSGGLRPFPFGQGTTWITNQLNGAWASSPLGGPVSSSPRPCRRSQLTWHTISGAVKRPHSGLRSGAKRLTRSSTSWRRWASNSEGTGRLLVGTWEQPKGSRLSCRLRRSQTRRSLPYHAAAAAVSFKRLLGGNSILALNQAAGVHARCDVPEDDATLERAKQRDAATDQYGHAPDNEAVDEARLQKPVDGEPTLHGDMRESAGRQHQHRRPHDPERTVPQVRLSAVRFRRARRRSLLQVFVEYGIRRR